MQAAFLRIRTPPTITLATIEPHFLQDLDPNNSTSSTSDNAKRRRDRSVEPLRAPKSRKLHRMKCERCRLDKQKCLPIERIWPTKCDRCITKGPPCSESKRTDRKNDYTPNFTQNSQLNQVQPIQIHEQEDHLRQWQEFTFELPPTIESGCTNPQQLASSCYQPFQIWLGYSSFERTEYNRFVNFVINHVQRAMARSTNELLALNKVHETGALAPLTMFMLMGQSIINGAISANCPICNPFDDTSVLQTLEDGEDVGSEFIARQNRLIRHFHNAEHCNSTVDSTFLVKKEFSRLADLEQQVISQVIAIFERYEMHDAAECSQRIDLFHNDLAGHWLFIQGQERLDCLGRSTLHQWLDAMSNAPKEIDLDVLRRNAPCFELNQQDLIGRSALHIACQKGWIPTARCLLDLGATPDIVTVSGHLPLNYAALNFSEDAAQLCDALLTSYDFTRRDQEGFTALDVALQSGNIGLFGLLDPYFTPLPI